MSTIIDHEALDTLLSYLAGDRESQRRFVADFVDLWDTRIQRLADELDVPDAREADTVLLSIRSSSAMVGALAVEATAALMHGTLLRDDVAGCVRHLGRLRTVGPAACRELAELFDLRAPAHT